MKPSIFVDSNVWFSAFYKEGICSKLLENIKSLGRSVFISELVLEEVMRNIQLKIPNTLSFFINYLKENKTNVLKNPPITKLLQYGGLAEKHDLPILVSAIEYKCDYFITGNLKDFDLKKIQKRSKIILISPKGYVELVGEGSPQIYQ